MFRGDDRPEQAAERRAIFAELQFNNGGTQRMDYAVLVAEAAQYSRLEDLPKFQTMKDPIAAGILANRLANARHYAQRWAGGERIFRAVVESQRRKH
jgi:hypothetical protein